MPLIIKGAVRALLYDLFIRVKDLLHYSSVCAVLVHPPYIFFVFKTERTVNFWGISSIKACYSPGSHDQEQKSF